MKIWTDVANTVESLITDISSDEWDQGVDIALNELARQTNAYADPIDADVLDNVIDDLEITLNDACSHHPVNELPSITIEGLSEAVKVLKKIAGPTWYISRPFQLGRDVRDGWEGRQKNTDMSWLDGETCRTNFPEHIFEVREEAKIVIAVSIPTAQFYAGLHFANGGTWTPEGKEVSDACKAALGVS